MIGWLEGTVYLYDFIIQDLSKLNNAYRRTLLSYLTWFVCESSNVELSNRSNQISKM